MHARTLPAAALALAAFALASCGGPGGASSPGTGSGWQAAVERLPAATRADQTFSACMSTAALQCETQYGTSRALGRDDLATCGELSDESVRAACRWTVVDARVKKARSEKPCDALPDAEARACLSSATAYLAVAEASPARCLGLAGAIKKRGGQDGDYQASMCVIQALQAYQGRGAAEWCPKITHEENRAHCLRMWPDGGPK